MGEVPLLILQGLTFGIQDYMLSETQHEKCTVGGSLMPQLATALHELFLGEYAYESVSNGISLVAVNNIVDNDIGRSIVAVTRYPAMSCCTRESDRSTVTA